MAIKGFVALAFGDEQNSSIIQNLLILIHFVSQRFKHRGRALASSSQRQGFESFRCRKKMAKQKVSFCLIPCSVSFMNSLANV
jgi:hypothetical protein